jgi:2-isopropylmalate synthase
VSVDRNGGDSEKILATVKLAVGGETYLESAEGDGPVNALDAALRQCLRAAYPGIREIRLVDYKVRVLSASEGTAAKVRVLIESSAGDGEWSTVGVSTNIVEASWHALVDSLEYGLRHVLAEHACAEA